MAVFALETADLTSLVTPGVNDVTVGITLWMDLRISVPEPSCGGARSLGNTLLNWILLADFVTFRVEN